MSDSYNSHYNESGVDHSTDQEPWRSGISTFDHLKNLMHLGGPEYAEHLLLQRFGEVPVGGWTYLDHRKPIHDLISARIKGVDALANQIGINLSARIIDIMPNIENRHEGLTNVVKLALQEGLVNWDDPFSSITENLKGIMSFKNGPEAIAARRIQNFDPVNGMFLEEMANAKPIIRIESRYSAERGQYTVPVYSDQVRIQLLASLASTVETSGIPFEKRLLNITWGLSDIEETPFDAMYNSRTPDENMAIHQTRRNNLLQLIFDFQIPEYRTGLIKAIEKKMESELFRPDLEFIKVIAEMAGLMNIEQVQILKDLLDYSN